MYWIIIETSYEKSYHCNRYINYWWFWGVSVIDLLHWSLFCFHSNLPISVIAVLLLLWIYFINRFVCIACIYHLSPCVLMFSIKRIHLEYFVVMCLKAFISFCLIFLLSLYPALYLSLYIYLSRALPLYLSFAVSMPLVLSFFLSCPNICFSPLPISLALSISLAPYPHPSFSISLTLSLSLSLILTHPRHMQYLYPLTWNTNE